MYHEHMLKVIFMKKAILLSAIIIFLFTGSASARTVVDEFSDAFHKTTVKVGSVIDSALETVAELLGLHDQKVAKTLHHSISPSEMFKDAKLDGTLPVEENSSLILSSMYPELARVDASSSAQRLNTKKGSLVLSELKRQEEREDLTASEYTALATTVSQDASSAVPLLVGTGPTQSAVINWDGVTYNQNPNAETDALLAKMASTHTRNPNSALLSKAGN